jgi:hypothetical protein
MTILHKPTPDQVGCFDRDIHKSSLSSLKYLSPPDSDVEVQEAGAAVQGTDAVIGLWVDGTVFDVL